MTNMPNPQLEIAGDVLFVRGLGIAYAHFDIMQVLEENPQVARIHFENCTMVVSSPNDTTEKDYVDANLFAEMVQSLMERLPRYTPTLVKFEKCRIGVEIVTKEISGDPSFFGTFKIMFIDCEIEDRDFRFISNMNTYVNIKNVKGGNVRFHNNLGDLIIELEGIDKCSLSFIGNQRDEKSKSAFFVTLRDPKELYNVQLSGFYGKMKISGYRAQGKFVSSIQNLNVGEGSHVDLLDVFNADVGELWVSLSELSVRLDETKLRTYRIFESVVHFMPPGDKSGWEDTSVGWGNSSGSTAFFSSSEWLNYHLEIGTYQGERGYFCYKTFGSAKPTPLYWTIADGQVLRENLAMSIWQECAAGVNVAPLNWKGMKTAYGKVWKLFIPLRYLADVEITQPRNFTRPEKFRVGYAVLVEQVDWNEEKTRVVKILEHQRTALYQRIKRMGEESVIPQIWRDAKIETGIGWTYKADLEVNPASYLSVFNQKAFLVDVGNQSSLMDIYNRSNWLNDTPDKNDPKLYTYIISDIHTGEETRHENVYNAVHEMFTRLANYGDEEGMMEFNTELVAEIFPELIDGVIWSRHYVVEDAEYVVTLHAERKEGYARE